MEPETQALWVFHFLTFVKLSFCDLLMTSCFISSLAQFPTHNTSTVSVPVCCHLSRRIAWRLRAWTLEPGRPGSNADSYHSSIYLLFMAELRGLSLIARAGATLCCSVRASHRGGFSYSRAQALGTQASVVVEYGLSNCGY